MMKINLYTNNEPVFNGRKLSVSKDEIATLINQGYSYKEISTHYNRHRNWAYQIVKRFGLEGLFKIGEERNAEIVELSKSGISIDKIAEKFNMTFQKVVSILEKNSKASKIKPRQIKAERNEKIRSDLAMGMPQKEVAKKYKLSSRTIEKVAHEMDSINLKQARREYRIQRRKDAVAQAIEDVRVGQFLEDVVETNDNLREVYKKTDKKELRKEFNKQKEKKIISQIVELAHQGYGNLEISKKLNCSPSLITVYATRIGIAIKDFKQSVMQQRIKDLANAGYNLRAIAKRLNCTTQTIYNYMNNLPKSVWQKEYMEKRTNTIMQMHQEGKSTKEIAEFFNVSIATISRCIKKNQNKS